MRALALVVLVGCGTPPPAWEVDAGACTPFVSPPASQLMTPAASFANDVMPVLTQNCSSSSCHGVADAPKGNLFLGAQLAHGSDAAQVYAGLVGPTSAQMQMAFVAPGDPAQSYLMHKLDGDQCQFAAQCVAGDCGKSMPYDTGALDPATRDTLRRWIAQGAQQN